LASSKFPDSKTFLATILIIFATVLWGSTFITTKIGITTVPLFLFQTIRHLIGLIILFPFINKKKLFEKPALKAGFISSIVWVIMIMLITYGVQAGDAGKGAFLNALYVPITPFIAWILLRAKILPKHWMAVVISVIGMGILVFGPMIFQLANTFSIQTDYIMILAAFAGATQIVVTEKYTKQIDAKEYAFLQFFFATGIFFIGSLILKEPVKMLSIGLNSWIILLYLGIFTTSLTQLIQNFAQRRIPSTRAALIYALEPVFATIFAIFFGEEQINLAFILGAILILTGAFIAVIETEKKKIDSNI
jgi:drug/metabolite transporter (DMT)-like permease